MRKFLAVAALTLAACGSSGGDGGTATVATPTFSPAAGTFHTVQSVTIACATSGAAIHYTTDGSTPTATSPTYGSAIAVTTTTTIKAMATATGQTDSAVASATYTLQAATPVITPAAGTYATTQSVTITSATPGATIHYTTDGSTPTATSATYGGAIAVTTTTTIKALATATGFADSAVASATYTLQAATPVITPAAGTYATTQSVTMTSATPGATIHYTTDGSTPTSASPAYTAAISLPVGTTPTTTTIKAMATATGFADSTVASSTFVLDPAATPAAAPTFNPPAGTYTAVQAVTISTTTAGAAIHYTTDGSTPTAASTTYSTPVQVAASLTLRAIAVGGGHTESSVASAAYVINLPQAATPTFNPPAGTYTGTQAVTISTTSAGASIHYTTDGSTPTTASTAYTAPVQVASSLTLKAIAAGTGYTASAVATAAYVINLPQAATPTFNPGPGTYTSAQSVTISSTTPSAVIHYTTDGSTPTTASTTYSTPVLVNASKTLKAIATATGYTTSALGSASYVISTGGSDFLTTCNALFDTAASLMATCLNANPSFVANLIAPQKASCPDLEKEITAGRITFDATQGANCNSAIAALSCSSLSSQSGFAIPAACTASLIGTVTTGGTCYSSNDCASGYCTWELASGTCPGTCQPFAGLNQACSTDAMCASGQVCDASTCKALAAAGGSCPCRDNLWCDASGGGAGICTLPKANGASCTSSDQCSFLSLCTGATPTCQPYVGLGATCDPANSRCGIGYECDSGTTKCISAPVVPEACTGFCVDGYCDFFATSPTCKAFLADGATCNPSYFGLDCASRECGTGSKCVSSRCVGP